MQKPKKGRRKQKKERTPKSVIASLLRRCWLFSVERRAALKRDNYECQNCGISKKEGAKLHVHHLDGSGIDEIIEQCYKKLLPEINRLLTLCEECHKIETDRQRGMK